MVPLLKETMIMRCSSQEKSVLKKMISISKQNPWMSIKNKVWQMCQVI